MNKRPSLPTFRLHLMLTAALVVLSFVGVAAFLIFVPLFAYLDHAELSSSAGAELAAYFIQLHESFWPVVLGAVIASTASGMVLFQRMKSPLTRFVAAYQQLTEGHTAEPIQIRKLDYLQDEADELNRMLEAIRRRDDEAQSNLIRIEETLCELEACELDSKLEAALAEIRNALGAMRRHAQGAK